jgi:hypothetical protein
MSRNVPLAEVLNHPTKERKTLAEMKDGPCKRLIERELRDIWNAVEADMNRFDDDVGVLRGTYPVIHSTIVIVKDMIALHMGERGIKPKI